MPYVVVVGGRTVVLEDADVRALANRLVRQTRLQVWPMAGGPDSRFRHYYRIWERHNRYHSVNLFVLTMETLGGADLPPASLANRLNREATQLGRLIRPASIGDFYRRFPAFNRAQGRFVRSMQVYMSRMIEGGGRTVRILELTRNSSFAILNVCAGILSGGATAAPQVSAAMAVGQALMREAAASFLLTQIEHSATRLGRSMAGERVTLRETGEDVVNSALNAVPNAMLGKIIGHFMGPMTSQLRSFATRELARGSLLRGVTLELSRSQVESAVGRAVDLFIGRQPVDIRRLLNDSRGARDNRGQASMMANGLQQNRIYRRFLEIELRNEA